MKIKVINSKEEINKIDKSEEFVHLTFRPSNVDIYKILQKCSSIKAIHVPTSYKNKMSKSTCLLLEMQNIALVDGEIGDNKKGIYEYL